LLERGSHGLRIDLSFKMNRKQSNHQPTTTNQQQAANAAEPRIYRGHPENQRDSQAVNEFKGDRRPKNSGPRKSRTSTAPARIPPPSQLHDASHVQLKTENPCDLSIFGSGLRVREVEEKVRIAPSAPALIDVARKTFAQIITDDSSLAKELLPEYLDYYATAMLWFRFITLKQKNSDPINMNERVVLDLIESMSFAVPEPITLYLRAFGNIVTGTRQHLYPTFPAMPARTINGLGGFFGKLVPPAPDSNDSIHNLYEEIPCLGVLADAIMNSVSNAGPGVYASRVTYQGHQPNQNLLGFRSLGNRRNEPKNLALDNGITDVTFQSYPQPLALNLNFLSAISDIIAGTRTFKVSNIVFSTLTEMGSQLQIIVEKPIPVAEAATLPALRGEIQAQSLISESDSTYGAGVFFSTQLFKLTDENDLPSWRLFDVIPHEWIDNCNERRNSLPLAYRQRVFTVVSQNGDALRSNVIKSLVLQTR